MQISKMKAVRDDALSGLIVHCQAMLDAWVKDPDPSVPLIDLTISVNGSEVDPFDFAQSMVTVLGKMANERAETMSTNADRAYRDAVSEAQSRVTDAIEDFSDTLNSRLEDAISEALSETLAQLKGGA